LQRDEKEGGKEDNEASDWRERVVLGEKPALDLAELNEGAAV
jgi:hypothetical protein